MVFTIENVNYRTEDINYINPSGKVMGKYVIEIGFHSQEEPLTLEYDNDIEYWETILLISNAMIEQPEKFACLENTITGFENDGFIINLLNISGIDNMEDVDGLFKINVMFTDNSLLTLEYYDSDKMNTEYEFLSNAFATGEAEPHWYINYMGN